MTVVSGEAVGGISSLRFHYDPGTVEAGWLFRMFGRNPVASQSNSTTDFQEIYWRIYYKLESGWVGNPDKVTRATSFWASNRSQAFIAHLWKPNASSDAEKLGMEPASCVSGSTPVCVGWNDFAHIQWLGAVSGVTPIYSSAQVGQWRCVEAHVKLNTLGQADGIFEFWIDSNLQARSSNLNWRGSYNGYGINTVELEGNWNTGSPKSQNRYMDNFVISRNRIGCGASDMTRPAPPRALRAN